MRVVVPYVGQRSVERHLSRPEVERAVNVAWPSWEMVNVGGSDRAYFDLLSMLWTNGQTFCIVEHDIVVHSTALTELAACPHDWCSYPFEYEGMIQHGLGCAKFSADLIARRPDALARVAVLSDGVHPKRHWCRLDAWLTSVLEGDGERRHEHTTLVRHLDPVSSHGCTHRP